MPTYQELLRDPRWLRKRYQILESRQNKCQKCQKLENEVRLTIHHGYYHYGFKKEPWNYEDESLWVLCWPCHMEAQKILLSVHKVLARIFPFDLEVVGEKIDLGNYEWINGISAQELADIFSEEEAAESTQHSDYSINIFSNTDLGSSHASEMGTAIVNSFPGIKVELFEDAGAPDCVSSVQGPDEKVRQSIERWCQKWI